METKKTPQPFKITPPKLLRNKPNKRVKDYMLRTIKH